jgi:hypothetical protein
MIYINGQTRGYRPDRPREHGEMETASRKYSPWGKEIFSLVLTGEV